LINHLSLGCHRFEEAIQFYSECFHFLGYQLEHRTREEAAFGPRGERIFWLYPAASSESIVGARCHIAVSAETREQVVKFHDLAVQRGGTTVRAPGARPEIGPDYFGTIVRDLDGHTIEVVQQTA
jgi:catechol 2,3-dioxygenase-like lactoylglutathione lyase family enzyme